MDKKTYFEYYKKCASCKYCEDLAEEGYRKCTCRGKQYIDRVTDYCSDYVVHSDYIGMVDYNGRYRGSSSSSYSSSSNSGSSSSSSEGPGCGCIGFGIVAAIIVAGGYVVLSSMGII